jgi:hypothetical protein
LLSSRAVSSARVLSVYHTQPISLGKGDISTLQKRGHFYFALTPMAGLQLTLVPARCSMFPGIQTLVAGYPILHIM